MTLIVDDDVRLGMTDKICRKSNGCGHSQGQSKGSSDYFLRYESKASPFQDGSKERPKEA